MSDISHAVKQSGRIHWQLPIKSYKLQNYW